MEKFEELKKVIQEANPEIMELKFGCETSRGTIVSVFESHGYYKYALDHLSANWPDSASVNNLYSKEELIKILGRPITLSDVLLALRVDEIDGSRDIMSKAEIVIIMWNKYDNNIDNQSDKCKEFLIELLVKK